MGFGSVPLAPLTPASALAMLASATVDTLRNAPRNGRQACWSALGFSVIPVVTIDDPKAVVITDPAPRHPQRIPFKLEIVYDSNKAQVDFDGEATIWWPIDLEANDQIRVFTAARDGEEIDWASDVKAYCNGPTLYAQGVTPGRMEISLSLEASGATPVARGSDDDTLTALALEITDDGGGPAKSTVFSGGERRLKATPTPSIDDAKYEWSIRADPSHNLRYIGDSTAEKKKRATVRLSAAGASAKVDDCLIHVTVNACGRTLLKDHKLTAIDCAIKHEDGRADPKPGLLVDQTRKYKAALLPANFPAESVEFRWSRGGDALEVAADEEDPTIGRVRGRKAAEEVELELKATVDGEELAAATPLEVTALRVEPELMPVVFAEDAVATVKAAGALEGDGSDFTWTLSGEGETEGSTTSESLKVKRDEPGVVKAKLKFKPTGSATTVEAEGLVVFIREGIKQLSLHDGAWTTFDAGTSPPSTPYEVLMGLSNDPAAWKVGRVQAESRTEPASVRLGDVTHVGTHTWKPPARGHVQLDGTQPAEHGADQVKVLLRALPKTGDAGPPADPGYTDETVKAEYAQNSVGPDTTEAKASAEFKVRVHRHGCNAPQWIRSGTHVSYNDRVSVCTHHTAGSEQWDSKAGWMGGDDPALAGAAISSAGGHQHGGRCHWCSGAASEHATASPRTVWHFVNNDATVLLRTVALANAIRAYVRNRTANAQFTRLLTDRMRGAMNNRGRMLGVLKGQTAIGGTVWLYALSGSWNADGDWCQPLGGLRRTDTSRSFAGFSGDSVTYRKTQSPFDTLALQNGFGKMGRCAAPVLLHRAKTQNLRNLQLHEAWVDTRDPLPARGFTHGHEIASCEQCRRILGAYLCERGSR